jgi:hypothetical protein
LIPCQAQADAFCEVVAWFFLQREEVKLQSGFDGIERGEVVVGGVIIGFGKMS